MEMTRTGNTQAYKHRGDKDKELIRGKQELKAQDFKLVNITNSDRTEITEM